MAAKCMKSENKTHEFTQKRNIKNLKNCQFKRNFHNITYTCIHTYMHPKNVRREFFCEIENINKIKHVHISKICYQQKVFAQQIIYENSVKALLTPESKKKYGCA